jgi:hypothetical protein
MPSHRPTRTLSLLAFSGLVVTCVVGWPGGSPDPASHSKSAAKEHADTPWRPPLRKHTRSITLQSLTAARSALDPAQQSAAMEELANAVSDTQAGAMLASLSLSDLNTEFASLLMRRWVALDPAAAAAWVAALPTGPEKNEMTSQLVVVWSEMDWNTAKEWVAQLPEGPGRNEAQLTLAYQASNSEPAVALNLALALPAGAQRDQFLSHAVGEWTALDASAAAQWVEQISDPTLRARLIATLATVAAETDATTAASLVSTTLPSGEEQSRAAVGVVQRWTQQDALAAASWVARFPEGPTKDAALENLVKLWTDQNAQQAAGWLNSLTDDSLRDQAISSYAAAISARSPATALQWAQTIKNPVLREKQLATLARH